MQLKRIQLVGFKSFVDVTSIPILSHMNAIVGPNGCGKSNIVDAIRWVSGETSAKQLRGQSMSDVIFNGTAGRQPIGKASVELTFDNSDGRITGNYAGFSEISVKREVVREGQSSYFINGVHARRRDLIDLFLGTGLGPRSYAIIEQGMIAQLIEAKPDELRTHLEEVAGVSKYRERRRETENRIRHTRDNLDRLNDLSEELNKQLRHLKRQSNAAERYKVLKQEERLVHAQMKALQWQAFDKHLLEKNEKIQTQTLKVEEQLVRQRSLETDIEKTRLQSEALRDEKNQVQKAFYGLGAEIARLEQQIQHKKDQVKQWEKELEESESLWEELAEHSDEHRDQIRELSHEVNTIKPRSEAVKQVLAEANRVLEEAEQRMQKTQDEWDAFQEKVSQTDREIEVAKTNVAHYEAQIEQLNHRREQSHNQMTVHALDDLSEEIQLLKTQVDNLKATVTQAADELTGLSTNIQAQRESNHQAHEAVTKAQGELQKLEARYASLEALQQSALENQQTDFQQWMTVQNLTNQPRLGKEIIVETGWELAVETVLGDYFDAICVNELDSFVVPLNQLPTAHITLLHDYAVGTGRLSQRTVSDVISGSAHLPAWLSNVYVADDLSAALQLQSHLNPSESVITKDGIWVGANWLRASKINQTEETFLVREKTLKQLCTAISSQKERLAQQETLAANALAKLEALESSRDVKQQAYQAASTALTEAQAILSAKQSRLDELIHQEIRLKATLQEIEVQRDQYQQNLSAVNESIAEHSKMQASEKVQKDLLISARSELTSELIEARSDAQLKKQDADELMIRLTANENQLAMLKKTVDSNQKQLAQLAVRREELKSQLSGTDKPIQVCSDGLQTALTHRVTVEATLQEVDARFHACQNHLKQLESDRQSIVEALSVLQETQQQLRMEQQEIVIRQSGIKEQIAETAFDLETLQNEMPPDADFTEWEARSSRLKTKIDRLGPINLAAIDEFQSVTERKMYLDKQYQDLEEALSVLQNAIQKIDRETRHLFKETFNHVNEKFQQLFPRIFGGGRASLALTEDNLLTAGIIVKAQPPGKRNTTIHMLSGGEKTLAAIALMFAMFQMNPAPFCVLDEVDAPLDDLNVGRFCQLVKEMSRDTQFLVISHNKVTIEIADHLMGVTMQEKGVSRIVSVDMQEAVELVEA